MKKNELIIHEIFRSVQGESSRSGLPCIFIRLYGCNVCCSYCDQPQKVEETSIMEIKDIMNVVKSLKTKYVCITGGEPLMQKGVNDLIRDLANEGYMISIETNGTVFIDRIDEEGISYVVDVKTPSAQISVPFNKENLIYLKSSYELKFVIKDKQDYIFMRNFLKTNYIRAKVLVSPMFDINNKQNVAKELCEWVLEDELDVRLQLQIHKLMEVQ
ncbi:MAG: 7-carboxy-7-deazaguanine synthase QueE [Peptostreptococcaceae bacterium]